MRADIERFEIDQLLAEEPGAGPGRLRSFAVQLPELGSVGVHWHDYYELGYVLEGTATHVVNGVAEPLATGSGFLLSPADFHALEVTGPGPLRVLNAVLDPQLVESVLESTIPSGDTWLPWTTDAIVSGETAVARIREELSGRAPGWDVVVDSVLRGLVVELARSCAGATGVRAEPEAAVGSSPGVRRAVRYVERHFREPLTLGGVAAVAHLSPHWFSEQFRLATGDSFQRYLKRRRLQFARALLESTELGVTEVCHAAGFNDPSYFGRAYRAQYGVSPSGRVPRRT